MNSQTRIADHVDQLTERIVRDLRRHVDSDKLTADEIVRAERAVARQLLTGHRGLFRGTTETDEGLIAIGQECIDSSLGGAVRFVVEPSAERKGYWSVRNAETGETHGQFSATALANAEAEALERAAAAR
jgi:hypothetical protein